LFCIFCPFFIFPLILSLPLPLPLPGEDLLAEAEAVEASLPTLVLSAKDEKEKKKLMEEGFGDWTRKDYRAFTAALEQFGRKDREAVFRQVGV
jgi:SWI/SNF-related matrix-associated actin-dependent regulator of chromatin subfamily A member 5